MPSRADQHLHRIILLALMPLVGAAAASCEGVRTDFFNPTCAPDSTCGPGSGGGDVVADAQVLTGGLEAAAAFAASSTSLYVGTNEGVTKLSKDGATRVTIIENRPQELAVDSSSLYWFDLRGVHKSGLDGQGRQQLVASGPLAIKLVVNEARVYWATFTATATDFDGIFSLGEDGAGPQLLVPSPLSGYVRNLAVDSTHLYWSGFPGSGGTYRARKDGLEVELLFKEGASHIAVDETHFYYQSDSIYRRPKDGSGRAQLVAPGGGPFALDSTRVYWGVPGAVFSVRKDGSGLKSTAKFSLSNPPVAVLVDETSVYVLVNGTLVKAPK